MEADSKIYVAGHTGMVGSALVRKLKEKGFDNIIYRSSKELDLRDAVSVAQYFSEEKPEYIFLAAAKVGGILANNTYRADFLYDNLMIESNIIYQAYKNRVKKLLFLGSSCIYPKFAPQPIKEESLLTGKLEFTNEPYAIAKIAGIKLCEAFRDQYNCNFISVMPSNLYGQGDNYHPENAHVLPALIRRFHEAKESNKANVVIWGTGSPRREFLFADDLADACIFLMNSYDEREIINIGYGEDISIRDLAVLIKDIIGYTGAITFDETKPDGTPRKIIDSSRLNDLGWKPSVILKTGIKIAYENFLQKQKKNQPHII